MMAVDVATLSLLIALLALFVTLAQAIQQYLVTGQLIRICDSVVYGKMPGQGRRVWQFSQFRFRVVYCIPQISLPSSLWHTISFHPSSDIEGGLSLPDLRAPIEGISDDSQEIIKKYLGPPMFTAHSSTAGEASWVSFTRAVQYSCGKSLRYELIEGDADRCPADLPVVPMQLSMRDVITVAIMAGMKCTDFSFQHQSLSMQGTAGTITTSRHPVLGALIHFAPKRPNETHGFQTNDGSINHHWVARMWDVFTVAGNQFNLQDRKHFEEDEGPWIKLSGDRTVITHQESSPQKLIGFRKRRGVKVSADIGQSPSNASAATSQLEILPNEPSIDATKNQPEEVLYRKQDGDWSFVKKTAEKDLILTNNENLYSPPPNSSESQSSRRTWYQRPLYFIRKHLTGRSHKSASKSNPSILPISERIERKPYEEKRRSIETDGQSNAEKKNSATPSVAPKRQPKRPLSNAREAFNKDLLKSYIKEKQMMPTETSSNVDPELLAPRFLLTNREASNKSDSSSHILAENPGAEQEKKVANTRAEQVVQKWQNLVQRRREAREQKVQEEDDELRSNAHNKSDSSFRSRSRRMTSRSSRSSHSHSGRSKSRDILRGGRFQSVDTDRNSDRPISINKKSENVLGSRGRRRSPSPPPYRKRRSSSHNSKPLGRRRNSGFALINTSRRTPVSVEYGDSPIQSQKYHSNLGETRDHHQPTLSRFPSKERDQAPLFSDNHAANAKSNVAKDADDIDKEHLDSKVVNPIRGVLKKSRDRFPEDIDPIREGVAPLALPGTSIPRNARWTKIDRKIVSPEALEGERFEEREDYIIVLRVLSKEEIEKYALKTFEIRSE